jgi:phage shock protein E
MDIHHKLIRFAMFAAAGLLLAAGGAHAAVGSADAAEIQRLLKEEPAKVLVVDVRTVEEWNMGHIPGSVRIGMQDVPKRLADIPKEKKIVLVCASGARSREVADYLAGRGYPWVKNYAPGLMDWYRKRLPLVR